MSNPFADFKPLEPKSHMGRNEPCWCRSGRKWKNSHRLRAYEKPLPASAFHARFFVEAKSTKICLHPKAPIECSGTFSAAHTIQKRTGLLQLAEDSHVLSARNRNPSDRSALLNRIGINSASTFYGFCSKHDNHTFKPAETSIVPTREVSLLLNYRALFYEIYMKKVAIQTLEYARQNLDRGVSFFAQVEIQQHLSAGIFSNSLGYYEHLRHKKRGILH